MSDCHSCGISDLGQLIGQMLAGIRPQSKAATELAARLKDTPGMAATLVLQIGAKPGDPVEATVTVGSVRVVLDPIPVAANAGLPEAPRRR